MASRRTAQERLRAEQDADLGALSGEPLDDRAVPPAESRTIVDRLDVRAERDAHEGMISLGVVATESSDPAFIAMDAEAALRRKSAERESGALAEALASAVVTGSPACSHRRRWCSTST